MNIIYKRMAEEPQKNSDRIEHVINIYSKPPDHSVPNWEHKRFANWGRIEKMFVAIYNNDFDNFKQLCENPPYYLQFYEKEYEDDQKTLEKLKNEGKLYDGKTKEQATKNFITEVLISDIKNNKTIEFVKTLEKFDLYENNPTYAKYGFKFSPLYYILIKFEKLFKTYNSTSTEQDKNNIKALWNMLTFSMDGFSKYKDNDGNDRTEFSFIGFRDGDIFQTFLRNIDGRKINGRDKPIDKVYEQIDQVIDKEGKYAFVDNHLILTVGEKAKKGLSSLNPFNRNKTTATSEVAAPATGPAAATSEVAPPEKKGFFSGLYFGKKDAAPATGETKKTGWFGGGGRKSRKQRKSKKQQKSRKHGKKSRSRK